MRIAQVAPLAESVPPRFYGGTERVVACLSDALVERGHQVTLFASGDSRTRAALRPQAPTAQRLNAPGTDLGLLQLRMLERVVAAQRDFDLIHFHVDIEGARELRELQTPFVTTLHGRLDIPGLERRFRSVAHTPFVSISDNQRRPLPGLNWAGTVHHGLDAAEFRFNPRPGSYLVFLGRISPEKRADRAIEIARRCQLPLRIAAKVDLVHADYFRTVVEPLLDTPGVEYLGELGGVEKTELLANAQALLFPIDWPEPFGLVMIEALACGTPVVAFRHGSVPEVLSDGETGFVVTNLEQAVRAVQNIHNISRHRCRQAFERRFTASHMADRYATIYRRLISEGARNDVGHHRRAGTQAARTAVDRSRIRDSG